MNIDTKTATGRRSVSYHSYDDILADAEKLARQELRTVGNWSFAQILDHLGKSFDASIDGTGFKLPLPMRFVVSLLFKKKFLNDAIPPGYKIGKSVKPKFMPEDSVAVEEGLEHLRQAIERCKSEPSRTLHPLFGNISREDWDRFSFRHAEMHMSFVVPGEE